MNTALIRDNLLEALDNLKWIETLDIELPIAIELIGDALVLLEDPIDKQPTIGNKDNGNN